ncbi:MAG TPA: hypothetical protein VF228_06170, partial [Iamia sp.]
MTPPDPTLPPGTPFDDGPLDDDTLAVHAVVDDEATAEQRRRVARDPELVAEVAELRATVAAVAAPVDPPSADVLADIRRRALDALDEAAPDPEAEASEEAVSPPPAPVRDLGAARARRTRSLPPLSAVAAVVVLLVLVGVGLLVAGTEGGSEDSADAGSSETLSEASGSGGDATESADDADGALTAGGELEDGAANDSGGRPSDETVDELLARSTASYDDEEDLLDELRRTDPDGLDLAGPTSASASTTAPPPTTTTTPGTGTGQTDSTIPPAEEFAT